MVTKNPEFYVNITSGELLPIATQYGPFPAYSMATKVARKFANDYTLEGIPYEIKITGRVYRESFTVELKDKLIFSQESYAEEAAGKIANLIGSILHYDQDTVQKFLELCIDIKREECPRDIEPIVWGSNYSKTLSSKESKD